MDSLISACVAYASKNEFDSIVNHIEKHQEVILRNPQQWNGAIDALSDKDTSTAQNTIAIIWIAAIRAQLPEDKPNKGTIATTENLILKGSYAQLQGRRKALDKWRTLIHRYAVLCREMGMFRRGIFFLQHAMDRFTVNQTYLSPIHSDYLMLCLKGCMPHIGARILTNPILEVDPKSTGVNATDYLTYYYYAGLTYIGLKNWPKALKALENCMTMLALGPSAIMVEAYKLYLLVGVIQSGRFMSIPKKASTSMERVGRQLCTEYMDFASACESKDQTRILKVLQENGDVFENDSLMPLVNQAQVAVVKQSILGLTKVYVTLSLQDMAEEVKLPQDKVKEMLIGMIDEGMINASISIETGMIAFADAAGSSVHNVEDGITRATNMINRVEQVDDAVSLSVPYVSEKLRNMPNYRELIAEYEAKRRSSRGVAGIVQNMMGLATGGGKS